MNLLFLLIILLNTCILFYAFYKIRKIHISSYDIKVILKGIEQETKSLYSQIQTYHDLVSLIKPIKPLPPLRGWAASPDFLLILATHMLSTKPVTILECSSGASTIVLARCCQLSNKGKVFSLEHDSVYAEKTKKLIKEHSLESYAVIIDAPLVSHSSLNGQHWYSLENLNIPIESVDMLVVDGPPSSTAPLARYPALPLLLKFIAKQCTIFLDDAKREAESHTLSLWKHEHPDFQYSMIISEKGCAKLERL